MAWKQLLIIGNDPPIPDPEWGAVAEAASGVVPHRSVILYRANRQHLRADGARFSHTIVFYGTSEAQALVVGRRAGGMRRGKAVLENDRVIVTPLELWASDGIDVFRAFYEDRPLELEFALRDPTRACSPPEIRAAIEGGPTTGCS